MVIYSPSSEPVWRGDHPSPVSVWVSIYLIVFDNISSTAKYSRITSIVMTLPQIRDFAIIKDQFVRVRVQRGPIKTQFLAPHILKERASRRSYNVLKFDETKKRQNRTPVFLGSPGSFIYSAKRSWLEVWSMASVRDMLGVQNYIHLLLYLLNSDEARNVTRHRREPWARRHNPCARRYCPWVSLCSRT